MNGGVLTGSQIFIDDLTDKGLVGRASASLITGSSKRKQRITAHDLTSRAQRQLLVTQNTYLLLDMGYLLQKKAAQVSLRR